MRRGVALLALALAAGCGTREHANPFDPQNSSTGGRPADFVALAAWRTISLRWTTPAIAGDFGYRLFRRIEGEADFRQIAEFGREADHFLDPGLTDATLHEYRLFSVFSGVSGGRAAEDRATPGPLHPWLTDFSRGSLIGTTPDGRRVVQETGGFDGPTHLAVDPTRGVVWLSDTYHGRVVIFFPSTSARIEIQGLSEPVALALDPIDQSAWVCDQALNVVHHYASNGVAGTPLSGIQKPIGVATDPGNATVWVCERSGNQVLRYTRGGLFLGGTPLDAPSRVAVDSLTRDAWVACFDGRRAVRITDSGAPVDTVPLSGPIGIAVDNRRGRIWVADALASQVVALDRSGEVEFRVGGLAEARDVAVDLATGEAWVTAPGMGALVRISVSGAIRERLSGFSFPYAVALDPGP